MMRGVFGVFLLSVRTAVRTKTAPAILVLLALVVMALPSAIKGDGTEAGMAQVLITYTLGLSFILLCVAVLWGACSFFAAEIDSKRIELGAVKPLSFGGQFLGKWLALCVLSAFALAFVYSGVYCQILRNNLLPSLKCRHVAHPVLPALAEEAKDAYRTLLEQGQVPPNIPPRRVIKTLIRKAPERYSAIEPGSEQSWQFHLAEPIVAGESVTIHFVFDTEFRARRSATGSCSLRCTDNEGQSDFLRIPADDFTDSELSLTINSEALAKTPHALLRNFELVFHHNGDARSAPLLLRFRKDVTILTSGGPFVANMARAAIFQFCILAALAAFGLALSACFSLPVAAFAGTVLLVLLPISRSVVLVTTEEDRDTFLNRAGIFLSEKITEAADVAVRGDALGALAEGRRIENDFLCKAFVLDALAIPVVFGILGCTILRRRELAEAGK